MAWYDTNADRFECEICGKVKWDTLGMGHTICAACDKRMATQIKGEIGEILKHRTSTELQTILEQLANDYT